MKRTLLYLALLIPATGFSDDQSPNPQQFRIYSREKIFSEPVEALYRPEKCYAEPDLDGDGTNDLIISDTVSFGGTGGLPYHVYLGKGNNSFQKIPILQENCISYQAEGENWIPIVTPVRTNATFSAGAMAIEEETKDEALPRKLWLYFHNSARSGSISYLYFDRNGDLRESGSLEIHSNLDQDNTGGLIGNAIFGRDGEKCIKLTKIKVPVIVEPIPVIEDKKAASSRNCDLRALQLDIQFLPKEDFLPETGAWNGDQN